ncbi:MAG: 3-hydroxyacyl-CoA dehydrogenase family protein [Desulfobacterota bacterium]|jgi:3-hydroxybutyryl-CoA dehydrogenase|nr:3-hydroxyacyl-CoA dehydrogenase family protein [Thermodesulfobacteriota bacterium]
MDIQRVFIVGSGLMGSGIAQVCAQRGLDVALYDIDGEALKRALKSIEWSVGKFVEKGELKEEKGTIMGRIKTASDFSEAGTCGLLIEAVFENIDLKKEILQKMDGLARPEALLASNTSSIPITELAVGIKKPERVLGLHFFSPVPMMQAVEVIRGQSTSDETMVRGKQFVVRIGKEPIMVNRDVAGFVINRINFPSTMEAMRLVEEGVTTVEDIDKGLRLASGRRMGIFETGDMVGLDVTYGALMSMYKETGDPRWFPPMILRRKVKSGELGRKTGKGWYEYDTEGRKKSQ